MANHSRFAARLRRHVRVRKQVAGTTQRPRLSVFRSLSEIYVQVIDDSKGHTLASASSLDPDLRDKFKGMDKSKQAQLVGKTVAERAKSLGINSVVFDRGGFRFTGRVKALADGAREGGLVF